MKNLLGAIAVVAIIVVAHLIPELALMILPMWFLIVFALGSIVGMAIFALWALAEAMKASEN